MAPLVGRDAELDELSGAVADAVAGRGTVAVVCGEPGIGKTRLLEAVVDSVADAAGVSAGWGTAWEGAGAPAFWPWVQALRTAAPDVAGALVETAVSRF